VQKPLVSCLVTAYNYERFLVQAVESALAQDYRELEVIVVNDGSTDRTGDLADALVARHGGRVRAIHQGNGGWTSAFNRAISEARGEFLAILDADDTWLPGKLRAQIELLAARPEVGLVYSDLAVIDENGTQVEPSFWNARGVRPLAGRCAAGLVNVGNTATTSTIVVRAALRDAFFPIPDDVPYGDWWVAFRTACVAEVAFVREPLSGYRFHGANLTLNAEGERLVRELRKEHQFRRLALAQLDPGVLTVAETMGAFDALEKSARTTLAAAGTVFCSLSPALPEEAQVELAHAEAAGPLARLRHLLRAVALDPWNDEARALLAATGTGLADRPDDREEPSPDGFVALGFLEEIVGTPDLLADYARVFEGRHDATLVVLAPGFDGGELSLALEPVALALGLDRDQSAEVVVLTEHGAGEELATVADALYTRVSRNGCFQHLPQIPTAETLLDLARADAPVATEAASPAPDVLAPSILCDTPPWAGEQLPAETVPGMITDEEKRYFRWIGRSYAGAGALVELGPWLGCSTHHIVAGLERSPAFAGRRLHVYDDFVWRCSWMDGYYDLADRPENHGDFRPIFDRYAAPIADRIAADKVKFVDYDGNQALPQLEWKGGAIEIIYIDCGRTIEANEAWWKIFAPHFVAGRTLVIMQDWQLWKEQPPQWYNQTKEFTDSKGAALELIHELRDGCIATFLYRGDAPLTGLEKWLAETPQAIVDRDHADGEGLGLLLDRMMRPDSCGVDVGANSGWVYGEFLRRAPHAHHIAYEPLPHLAEQILESNPAADVRVAAVSDENGERRFEHVKELPGYSGFHSHPNAKHLEQEQLTVRTVRLDDDLPAGYVPAMIKIDVEGGEYGVLQGALQTILRHKPLLVFEHGAASFGYGTTSADVYRLLADRAGYAIYDFDGNGPYACESFADAAYHGRYWNWFAVPAQEAASAEAARVSDERPNYLLLTYDSCRLDTLQQAHTPVLDSYAPIVAAQTPANFTYAAHQAFFVGMLPNALEPLPYYNRFVDQLIGLGQVGEIQVVDKSCAHRVASDVNLVAGLREAGYQTVGAGAMNWFKQKALTQWFEKFRYTGSDADAQIEFLRGELDPSKPFFGFVNFGETHDPFDFKGKEGRCPIEVQSRLIEWPPVQNGAPVGRNSVAWEHQKRSAEFLDSRLPALFDGLPGNTIVVLCGDHGEAFGEDGYWGHGVNHPTVLTVPLAIFRLDRKPL
jgi:FkbM family methyltransferase